MSPLRVELQNRPLVVAFLGLCAGLSCGFSIWNGLCAFLLIPLLWRSRGLIVLGAAVLAGWALRPDPRPLVVVTGGVFEGRASVISVPTTVRSGLSTVVEAKGVRYRLYLPYESDVNLGDLVSLRADIVPLAKTAVRQRLEVASLRPQGPVERVCQGFVGWQWAMGLRRSFLGFLEPSTDPVLVGLVDALCLNVTGDLGGGLYDSLRHTGTIHIVSASGLHVTIVSVVLAWVLLASPLRRSAQLSVLVFLLFLYAAAAGFHPAMIRSVVMVLVGSFAYSFRREPDGFTAMSLAGIANLLWEPDQVANLGFQLSYLAVAGLLMFGGVRPMVGGTIERIKAAGLSLARSSAVATMVTSPLVALAFGEVPTVSVLSNLLVVPVLPFVVIGGLAAWFISGLAPLSVGLVKVVVEPLAAWILASVETLGTWSWSVVHVPEFSPYWLVPVYGLMAALYRSKKRPADDHVFW